ncbi:MAG TPA: Eco57I restriction-modification methylase domain-containing protein, partial [Gammaproteobacteria bacterium]|nr:Eco57I restriction-modification methylase domain-containing protein [Gammaproteobacteria bacterium]
AAVALSAGRRIVATCYEVEPTFHAELVETLAGLRSVVGSVEQRDFIEHAVRLAAAGGERPFTHAILNPPYKKIGTRSAHRGLVRKLGLETTNLYACFLACAVSLCKPGGQVVAIIPRSFMNGPYFKPFRYWLLDSVALTHVHVFDSRDKAFADDEVLQENVVLRLVVGAEQGEVVVTASDDQRFIDVRRRVCPFSEIVTPGDDERFIHVPILGSPSSDGLPGRPLRERGLDVCTGPVVDFRLREHLQQDPLPGSVPLLYASHFKSGRFEWPKEGRKPNAIALNSETEKWLMPSGCYVVLRRFSSKEEKRRVVAYLLEESDTPGDRIGFENHLNVIHRSRRGLPPTLARGLVEYLNSERVDAYFRMFSGHTQVNATDLRRLRYPTLEELEEMGRSAVAREGRGSAAHPD